MKQMRKLIRQTLLDQMAEALIRRGNPVEYRKHIDWDAFLRGFLIVDAYENNQTMQAFLNRELLYARVHSRLFACPVCRINLEVLVVLGEMMLPRIAGVHVLGETIPPISKTLISLN